jgi:hypothetical protein
MPRARVRQALALLLLALASSGCIRIGRRGVSASVPIPSSVLLESRTLDHAVRDRPGLLTPEQIETIAPSIRALRADPVELSLLVGDTVRVADQVRILALDSAGAVLGEIPVYDFGYVGRGFRLLADGRVHLRRAGTVRFTARLPARHWSGRESARPSVQVALVVF